MVGIEALSAHAGVQPWAMYKRLRKGLSLEDAIARPRRDRSPKSEFARDFNQVPWDDDDRSWYVLHQHPEGLTLDQIGQLLGMTRERVRQIEEVAIRKLRHTFPDVAEHLEAIREREERKRA